MKPTQSFAKLLKLALGLLIASIMIFPSNAAAGGKTALHAVESFNTVLPGSQSHLEFKALAREAGIATRSEQGFAGHSSGYYVVAGVFGNAGNANRLRRQLSVKKLDARILFHSRKELNYVVIAEHETGLAALATVQSGANGKYRDKTWILHVFDENTEQIKARAIKASLSPERSSSHSLSFKQQAKEMGIASRKMKAKGSWESGYYLIAGVFGEYQNADRFVRRLRKKGYPATVQIHPESGHAYTIIDSFERKEQTLAYLKHYNSKANQDKVWALEVIGAEPEKNTANPSISEDNKKSFQASSLLLSRAAKDPTKTKLLEKADFYFGKMWYAEAAELYEQVLNRNKENETFEIIQKAGDAHYFNTNMERAYYWYDKLYSQYKDQMSAENLFKYAHSLKGTGKYGRAKRLMRLYNKKLKKEDAAVLADDSRATPREVILDNILSADASSTIKNLAINSKYSDFGPMYYNENELVFASAADSSFFTTRRYKWNNEPYLDLYAAKINEESEDVRQAVKFSKKINTKYHEASVAFTPDNQTMYFTRNNYGKKLRRDKHGVNHLKIYMSQKVDGEWSDAVEVPFNSDDWSTGHPVLSPDGKQMYFVSDRPGSLGESDIFVVDIMGDNQFSEPRNLGPEINTERREKFSFFTDKKMYFSSDGDVGSGGLDIFEEAHD